MKLECMKHGETEGIRQENGRLACEKCLAEKAAQTKKICEEGAKKLTDKLMEDLFKNGNPFEDLFGGLR